ncbi:MAG: M28 family metallopeptidase [Chloroflexi bacterium]|nr:M28 family metallopeptidase [Chloroflexota bacterium]
MDIIKHLSVAIGERPSGSPAEEEAASYLAGRFRDLGLEVEVQEFKFLGWRATVAPSLRVLAPEERELVVGAAPYTDSTPDEGATGYLRRAGIEYVIPGLEEWKRYAVVDSRGKEVAYILGNVGGRAMPMPNPNPLFTTPMVTISRGDSVLLEDWLNEGEEVRVVLKSAGSYRPDLTGHNVIATLAGQSEETVVVCAHFDSVPGSPGAIDNASGVQVVFDIASELSVQNSPRTIKFIAFGAEEDLLLGSRFYVHELKSRGRLANVKCVVNFDTVATGTRLVCRTGPERFRQEVEEVLKAAHAAELFDVQFSPPWASSDHYPFSAEGIPVVMLVLHPWDAYHAPTDNISVADPRILQSMTGIGGLMVRHCAGL